MATSSAGNLPVQWPTRYETVINLNTANALGLKAPRPRAAAFQQAAISTEPKATPFCWGMGRLSSHSPAWKTRCPITCRQCHLPIGATKDQATILSLRRIRR
jgi:hypothetical protein